MNNLHNCSKLADERVKAEATAMSDWLRRCRITVRDLRCKTFVKLLKMLVDAVLLCGAEVWGSYGLLGPIEKVQLRAERIFLGVGRLHP